MAVQETFFSEKPAKTKGGPETHLASAQAATVRQNNFNLLRLLFAVLVLLSHASELADGDSRRELLHRLCGTMTFGEVAVAGFFLLSGCLIVQSWQRTPDLADFLKKRILRIYPGFIAASLVSAAIAGPLGSEAAAYLTHFNLPHFLKEMVLLRTPAVPSVFAGTHYAVVNGSLWTIAYEFRCYLLVAAFGVAGLLRRRYMWLALTGAALVLLVRPEVITRLHFPGGHLLLGDLNAVARLVPFFCVGGCFALFRERLRLTARGALAAGIVLILCLHFSLSAQLGLATAGAYLLFWFAEVQSPLLTRFRRLPDISYGVYLYGWPVEKLLLWYFAALSPWLVFALACAICVLLGLASWFGVERPFLRLKPRKSVLRPSAALAPAP